MTKKTFETRIGVLLLAMLSIGFAACGSDDDVDDGSNPEGNKPAVEKSSPVIGTWTNTVSNNMVYSVTFKPDGTGFYIVEGTTESTFSTFKSMEFNFSTVTYTSSTTVGNVTVETDEKIGSIEINYADTNESESGTFTVTKDGRLELEGFSRIEKSIFNSSSETPATSIDLSGYWKGENTTSYHDAIILQVNSDKSGYIDQYSLDEGWFHGEIYEFSSYKVTGDIITFTISKQVAGTATAYVEEPAPVTSIQMRYQQTSAGQYAINMGGGQKITISRSTEPTNIGSRIVGTWQGENCFLRINGNKFEFARISDYDRTPTEMFPYITNYIAGSFTVDYGQNLFVTREIYERTEEYAFMVNNITSSSLSLSSFANLNYSQYGGTTFNPLTKQSEASDLYGTWVYEDGKGTRGGRGDMPQQFTFNPNGELTIIFDEDDTNSEPETGTFFLGTEGRLYLYTPHYSLYNYTPEYNKTYSVEITGEELHLIFYNSDYVVYHKK